MRRISMIVRAIPISASTARTGRTQCAALRGTRPCGGGCATGKAGGKGADILHCHDWQAALAPVYLKYADAPAKVKTVMTVHNIAFQGQFRPRSSARWASRTGLRHRRRRVFTAASPSSRAACDGRPHHHGEAPATRRKSARRTMAWASTACCVPGASVERHRQRHRRHDLEPGG